MSSAWKGLCRTGLTEGPYGDAAGGSTSPNCEGFRFRGP
jgi:hypothetical protein